jgi:2-succinyl-6-hydroxy-2,4-cyclohexadiene-1-carboxylate synthase
MTETVLYYEEAGRGEDGVFVFLHGFMGNCRSLQSVMAPLARSRRCVAFDLPGHGRSRFGQSERLQGLRSMEDAAGLLLTDLEALGIGRFSLYGYSMGGRIAQNMALLAPGRIELLILESASFGINDPEQRRERYLRDRNLLADIHTKKEFAAFLDHWHRLPLFRTLPDTPHLSQIIREKQGNSIAELQQALGILSVGNHPSFAGRLVNLGLPIHFFCGREDEAYVETGRHICRRFPELVIREFPGASHDIHSQFPEKIVDAILEIISSSEMSGK